MTHYFGTLLQVSVLDMAILDAACLFRPTFITSTKDN